MDLAEPVQFILSGKAFLSVLALAEAKDLEVVCSKLLPHKLTFNQTSDSLMSTRETSQATHGGHMSPLGFAEGLPSSEVFSTNSYLLPCPTSPTLQPATAETLREKVLLAPYNTLEDTVPVHDIAEWAASAHSETVDPHHNKEMQEYPETPMASRSTSLESHMPMPTVVQSTDNIPKMARSSPADGASHLASQTVHYMSQTSPSLPQEQGHNRRASKLPSQRSQSYRQSSLELGSHFGIAFAILTSIYGDSSEYAFNSTVLIDIIKLGDSFLRVDSKDFIESFRLGSRDGLWGRPLLTNPTLDSTITERLFISLQCAEILEQGSAVDPVRMRVARVILYHYYEQLCITSQSNPSLLSQRSRGRDTASVVIDKILGEMYSSQTKQASLQKQRQRRESLHRHKKIGRRWCILAAHLGLGVLLVCHPNIETQM